MKRPIPPAPRDPRHGSFAVAATVVALCAISLQAFSFLSGHPGLCRICCYGTMGVAYAACPALHRRGLEPMFYVVVSLAYFFAALNEFVGGHE